MNIRHVISNVARQLKTGDVRLVIRSLMRRANLRWHEWYYGIHTDSVIELSTFGIYNEECRYYSATDYTEFGHIMRALAIDPREHVFFDYGAGMGRAMILAATYPFRRVLGVEIAPELASIAKENISRCSRMLRCTTVEIITGDATSYEIPPGVTVFYFYNPFFGGVLKAVLEKVCNFCMASDQPVSLVCNLPPSSAFEKEILSYSNLRKHKEVFLPTGRRCLIFRAEPIVAHAPET